MNILLTNGPQTDRQPALFPDKLGQDRARANRTVAQMLMAGPQRSQTVQGEIDRASGALSPAAQQQLAGSPNAALARQLMQEGSSSAPIRGGIVEGLSRMGKAWIGRDMMDHERGQAEAADQQRRKQLAAVLQGVQAGDRGAAIEALSRIPGYEDYAISAALQPTPETELLKTVDPETGATIYTPESEAAGMMAELPPSDAPQKPVVETFYDHAGQEYRAQWDAESGTWERIGGSKRDTSQQPAAEQKIARIMGAYGVDRRTATGIADGVLRVQTDPVTNQPFLVNLATSESMPLNAPEAAAPGTDSAQPGPIEGADATAPDSTPQTAAAEGPPSVWSRAENVVGFGPSLGEAADRVAGQAGVSVAPEITQDRQFVRTAQNDLIRALSINPRFPVGEINRIREEVNLSPGAFDSPGSFRQRAIAVDDYLRTRERNELDAAADASLPVQTRQDAASAARAIQNFRSILGVPPRIQNDEEYDALPPGAEFIGPDGKPRMKPMGGE